MKYPLLFSSSVNEVKARIGERMWGELCEFMRWWRGEGRGGRRIEGKW